MVSKHFTSDHLTFVDLSLSRIRLFLSHIDNPQDKIKNIIHVSGTNGKGSTCAFLRTVLEGHGYSVNVFTSPHLVSYNERFRLHGNLITDEYLEKIKSRLEKVDGFKDLTIFELTMVIGFVAFYENPADFNIIEVGLGGRLDASNIIKNPLLSIITTIDFDHQNFLGNTLEQIAYEKAGIIKSNSKVIIDYQKPKVVKIIKKQSSRMNSQLIAGGIDYEVVVIKDIYANIQTDNIQKYSHSIISQKVSKLYNIPTLIYKNKEIALDKIALQGNHQYYNASLAIVACINILKEKFDYINITNMLENVEWRGRLQQVHRLYEVNFKNTDVYLDGAHNVSGVRVLCDFIETKYKKNSVIHIFIGMLSKKDLDGFFEVLSTLSGSFNINIYPVEIQGHSSYSIKEISVCAKSHNLTSVIYNNFADELKRIENTTEKNVVIMCGSLYLLGKILEDNAI